MEGYELDFENPEGQHVNHWDKADNIVYYQTVTNNGETYTVEKTVSAALTELYNKAKTSTTNYNGLAAAVSICQTDLALLSSTVRGHTSDITELQNEINRFSITIDETSHHWVINGEETEYLAVPEPLSQEDIATLAQTIATMINIGNSSGSGIIARGTYQQAYDYVDLQQTDPDTGDPMVDENQQPITNKDTMFGWMLDEVDDNGNNIIKVIYHLGNHVFIDALGGRVIGRLQGLNIS